MPLRTNIVMSAKMTETGSLDRGPASAAPELTFAIEMLTGFAANQADRVFTDDRTLAASTNDDLDLAGGVTNSFGTTITFAKVKAIFVTSKLTNTTDLTIGGAPANGFIGPFGAATHTIKIPPGGGMMIAGPGLAGVGTVTAATADLLRIANGAGAAADYSVVIIGTSA